MKRKLLTFIMSVCILVTALCGAVPTFAASTDDITVTNMSELYSAISNARHSGGPKTIYLAAGTYTVTANDQLLLYGCDGISLIGQTGDAADVVIECGTYTSSGMAGMTIMTNDVTIANITIKNTLKTSSPKPVVKLACYDDGNGGVTKYSNVELNNVVIENNSICSAMIIHGVDDVIMENVDLKNEKAYTGFLIRNYNKYYPLAIASSTDVSITDSSIHSAYEKAAPIGFNYEANNYLYTDISSLNIIDTSSITCTYGSNTANQGIVVVSERPASAGLDAVKVDGVQIVKTTDTAQDGSSNVTGWYAYDATDWADYDAGYLYTNSNKTPSDIETE